jgi:hypothetical protein
MSPNNTRAKPFRGDKAMTAQMVAALSAATLAFRDMAVGLGARLLEAGNDPATWVLIDEQLLFVSHECRTLADTAERWRRQGKVPPDQWLAFCNRAKAVHDKVSAWETALKVAGSLVLLNQKKWVDWRSEECGADGGGDGSGKRWVAASVATAFRRRGALVGRESLGQSTRDGAAGNRAPWADRSVDHRRHGFSQAGRHSVGVARQYCGQLGKQDNCSIANHHASLPVAYQLYLPKDWAKDRARRRKAGVPKEISFKTKPQIVRRPCGGDWSVGVHEAAGRGPSTCSPAARFLGLAPSASARPQSGLSHLNHRSG